jgi:hypothetical protein
VRIILQMTSEMSDREVAQRVRNGDHTAIERARLSAYIAKLTEQVNVRTGRIQVLRRKSGSALKPEKVPFVIGMPSL